VEELQYPLKMWRKQKNDYLTVSAVLATLVGFCTEKEGDSDAPDDIKHD